MSVDARTVSFLSLLRGTAYRCGLDPDALALTEAAALAEHLSLAARKAWRHYDWPDTIRTEKRALRPLFSFAALYALGDEVYDEESDAYYAALLDGFSGKPVSDAAYWEPALEMIRSLALVSPGDTPIGEVLNISDSDPDSDPPPLSRGFRLSDTAIELGADAPNVAWIRFRLPPPRFTTEQWDASTTYAPGDISFLSPHCYLALDACIGSGQGPTQAPARWRVQDVPELLEDAVKRRAKAEWLSSESQDEKAVAMEKLAEEDLDTSTETLSQAQGQSRGYAVITRTRGLRAVQPLRLAR